ncbi:MAG TPA: hypothetical protein VGZ69_04580 [Candidatus Rhabdochlamydia sp.]|jgi:hypothetical protein|nr:hypothetical protein [Candidatus Rhabdochlamydia sp.]
MAAPLNPLASSVVYNPINPSSTKPSTSAKIQNVSVKEEKLEASSSHTITVIHPAGPSSLSPLLEEGTVAPANSEVVLNEEPLPSEISVDKTQSIFNRFCCCCRK